MIRVQEEIIDTSEHRELGFNLEQRLVDIDDRDNTSNSSPISADKSWISNSWY